MIFGQKRQGEQDEVIKGYDLFRHDVKKSVCCVSVGISFFHMKRKQVLFFRWLFSLFSFTILKAHGLLLLWMHLKTIIHENGY